MDQIGSVRSYSYQPNYYNPKTTNPVRQENNSNLNSEIKELKKEHSKTRKALIDVSVGSALLIGGLLLHNRALAKKAKLNTDAIKTKLKDAVQKLKDTTKSPNANLAKDVSSDILDFLVDIAIWA